MVQLPRPASTIRSKHMPGGGRIDAIAHLAAIVDSSQDAIIGKTLDGRITSWNPAAERIYGYTAAEAVGKNAAVLLTSHGRADELTPILRRVARGERVDHGQTARRRKDGREIDVSVTVSPIRAADGQVVGAATVTRDVTESKRIADALAEAEERFRSAFEEAPIGMALLDLEGCFTKVNEALCAITGYRREELEGMSFRMITRPDDVHAEREALARIRAGEQPLSMTEKRCIRASGDPVWVAAQTTLIRGRNGAPRHFLEQVQDITDRKRYEDKLQDLADHDALTGLLNRRSFSLVLDAHAAHAARYGAEGALLLLDLDHFKYVNDTVGHQAGDEVIVRAADRLGGRASARPMSSPGSEVTSSPCCCPRPMRAERRSSRATCSKRLATSPSASPAASRGG